MQRVARRAAVLLLWPWLAAAQAPLQEVAPLPPADTQDAAANAPDVTAAADDAFAAFVDGTVQAILARDDIPGMAVAVVDRERVRLVRGYGLASLDPPRPVDGAATLFRIGSVSKTFTYVLAMQLVEQGRIGLDDPIDLHLPPPLRVPEQGYAQPIRVRHLLTHTAGFEDTALGHLFERDPEQVLPLDAYLVRWRPQRVRPPDSAAVYSNYGVALLGALVSHVAGQPFETLVEQRLTGPLGMARTRFGEPGLEPGRAMDAALAADLATGYERRDGAWVAGDFEHIAQIAPAGSASSTAADMARWMRMHLGDGALDGVRVLAPETAQRMRQVLFANAEGASGIAHGFLTEQVGGAFAYGHGGATLYFHTAMALLPERGLGVFVAANGAQARGPVRDVARQLLLRLSPAPAGASAPPPAALSAAELARYTGRYASNRRPYRSAETFLRGALATVSVHPGSDGSLRLVTPERVLRFLPTGPDRFRSDQDEQRLVFLASGDGRVTGFVADPGIAVMERLPPLAHPDLLALLLTVVAAIALLRLLGLLRRRPPLPAAQLPRPGLGAVKALSVLSALAWLGFVAAAIVAVLSLLGQGSGVMYSYPGRPLLVALALATAVAVLTLCELLALVPVWGGRWKTWPKLRYSLAVGLGLWTVVLLWQWNLIGMRV